MKFSVVAISITCALFISLPNLCQSQENQAAELQEKMLENAGKMSELIQANDGVPVPLLANDELLVLIEPMKERFEKAGKKYTDLEMANMLGAIAVGEALRRNMAKAFSK